MRIGNVLVVGALMFSACASIDDVSSTSSRSSDSGEQLPPVDDPAVTAVAPQPSTSIPGTRPTLTASLVLLDSDLPGWIVNSPMDVWGERTWEALDCADMNLAWGATGRAGTRSRGKNDDVSFRNTAVEFPTSQEASEVLDAVDRVWTECPRFESGFGSFWSEPIVMPPSTHRTAGLAIGTADTANWTLAFWQIDTTVVVIEIEGRGMWTYLEPLLATLSARLDGTPVPMDSPREVTTTTAVPDSENLPVIVPATEPVFEPAPTTLDPQPDVFPPSGETWTEHPLVRIAPTPDDLGPGWEYQNGDLTNAAPADPDDAIPNCDAPVPPTLDGYDLEYRNRELEEELAVLVGTGTAAESQTWIDALGGIAGCVLDDSDSTSTFDLLDETLNGVDDAVFIAGVADFGGGLSYVQVIGAARVDGIVVVAFLVTVDEQGMQAAVARTREVLALMVAAI